MRHFIRIDGGGYVRQITKVDIDGAVPAGFIEVDDADRFKNKIFVNGEPVDPPDGAGGLFISPTRFRELFTLAERIAITSAKKTDVHVEVLMDDVASAKTINLDYPPVVAGINYLRTANLLDSDARVTDILSNTLPE